MRPGAIRRLGHNHQRQDNLMPGRVSFGKALSVTSTVAAWWWLMMAVHELGHVLGCLVSGATIEYVTLWPWTISQTMRSGSHAPLSGISPEMPRRCRRTGDPSLSSDFVIRQSAWLMTKR